MVSYTIDGLQHLEAFVGVKGVGRFIEGIEQVERMVHRTIAGTGEAIVDQLHRWENEGGHVARWEP